MRVSRNATGCSGRNWKLAAALNAGYRTLEVTSSTVLATPQVSETPNEVRRIGGVPSDIEGTSYHRYLPKETYKN
jgi:hypothetical protein